MAQPPFANRSEVAQLRAQIEREHNMMMWAKTGLVEGSAKHLYINRRYKAIGEHQEKLKTLVGREQANKIVNGVFMQDLAQEKSVH